MIVVRLFSIVARIPGYHRISFRALKKLAGFCLAIGLLLSNLFLVSCTGLFGGGTPTPTARPTPSELALAQLHWCSKPSMVFRNEGAAPSPTPTTTTTATASPGAKPTATAAASATGTTAVNSTPTATVGPGTPSTITQWSDVAANLGFAVYLPPLLPRTTCLVNAQATIHDPIIGGSFTIGYLLPDHSALTLSEAPLITQNSSFQCNSPSGGATQANNKPKVGTATPSSGHTQVVTFLCSGAKNTTNIVLSARGSADYVEQIFNNLQPGIAWIPAS